MGLEKVILLFGMETILRGCVFGWHGRERFFLFSKKYFFGGVGWGGIFFSFLFSFII